MIQTLAAVARRMTGWAERWMPDAFVFALLATVGVLLAAVGVDAEAGPAKLLDAWGKGFWSLSTFTLQMCMILVGGYLLASAPPVWRLIRALAGVPRSPRSAVVLVAVASMGSSLLNWGFSLIFSAMLAKAVARRMPKADYPALAASAFLGLGTVWAQGLSGSAALQMASPTSIPKALAELVGQPIPLTETIFRPNSLICVGIEILAVACLAWIYAPASGRSAVDLGVELGEERETMEEKAQTVGERLEQSSWVLAPLWLLGGAYLLRNFWTRADNIPGMLNLLDFNTVNLFFLVLGAALHRTPNSMMRAVRQATPGVWGVLLQFPVYGGIAGIMTETQLSHRIATFFVGLGNVHTFPAIIALYSTILGIFVPSGGSKWVIEAPYVLQAGRELGIPDGWMVVTYDLGEAVANLLQPFWMLPTLAILGLKARDILGYTWFVAIFMLPLVLVLLTVFNPA